MQLEAAGAGRGGLVGLSVARDAGAALAAGGVEVSIEDDPIGVLRAVEEALRPRWVWWANDTATALIEAGLRVATCWDIAAVHRLLVGGWHADMATVWAVMQTLPLDTLPSAGPLDLFTQADQGAGDLEEPIRPDGYLRPEWVAGAWAESATRRTRWATLALDVAHLQQEALERAGDDAARERARATARSESAAELLCAELTVDGLPMDRGAAEAAHRRASSGPDRRRRPRPSERRAGATPTCCATPRRAPRSTCAARPR